MFLIWLVMGGADGRLVEDDDDAEEDEDDDFFMVSKFCSDTDWFRCLLLRSGLARRVIDFFRLPSGECLKEV